MKTRHKNCKESEQKTGIMKFKMLSLLFVLVACKATSQEFVSPPDDKRQGGKGDKKGGNPEAKFEVEADCNADLEFDQDANLIYHMKSGLPFTGVCRSYFEDGRLEREAHFRDGIDDGEIISLYRFNAEEGKQIVQSRLNHKMGLPHGKWEFWYENGQKAWEQNYVDGKKDGSFIWYFDDGKKKKEEEWKDDLKNGASKEYYPDEVVKKEVNYKNGIMDGKFILYYENGQTNYEGNFKDGKEDGEIVTYYPKGQMSSQRFFKLGVSEGEWRTWYDDGKEKSIEHFVKGVKEGECKTFFSEGQIKTIETWLKGKMVAVEEYDEFGNMLDPEEMKNKIQNEEEDE